MSLFTRRRLTAASIIAGVTFSLPVASRAAVNFVFNFTDAAGVGFNASGAAGADRRAGLNQAADYIEAFLGNYTATINLDVNGSVTNDNTLASASSHENTPYNGPGFGSRGDVMVKILGGADPAPGADGQVNWNFEAEVPPLANRSFAAPALILSGPDGFWRASS